MIDYYSKRAPFHDEYMSYQSNAATEELLSPIIRYLEPFIVDRTVLEIACGTGNWTQVLARRAGMVLATDVNESVLEIARTKEYEKQKISFISADAYSLKGVTGPFETAFAADWWSHIPISDIPMFLDALHSKLPTGASVCFLDMLPFEELLREEAYIDQDGNRISRRQLPDGGVFEVVKNFPSESELLGYIGSRGRDIEYREFDALKRWTVTYVVI